jgi:hypothetical protein
MPRIEQLPTDLGVTIPFAAGTSILVGLLDANSQSGGISNPYIVGPGATADCLSQASTSTLVSLTSATISARATVRSCETIDFAISGGTPPYRLFGFHNFDADYFLSDASPSNQPAVKYEYAESFGNASVVACACVRVKTRSPS